MLIRTPQLTLESAPAAHSTNIDTLLERIHQLAGSLMEAAPEQVLSRKQRKQAKKHASRERVRKGDKCDKKSRSTLSPGERARKFGHKFANETTFKKGAEQGPDPGGALISTTGLRRHLSKRDPKVFASYSINKATGEKNLGRYPVRVKNRASLAGSLRQASKRKPDLYRKLRETIKGSAHANKMFRRCDPSERQSNIERPVPLGGDQPDRPHGDGGPLPTTGPKLKDAKKVSGKKAKREARRRASEIQRVTKRARAFMGKANARGN